MFAVEFLPPAVEVDAAACHGGETQQVKSELYPDKETLFFPSRQ